MSLLLVAIVQNDDADCVVSALGAAGHRVTRVASVGGFLGTQNTTLILGIEEEREPEVVAIFERECSGREVEVPLVLLGRLRDALPRMVRYAGATIFVVELRSIIRF